MANVFGTASLGGNLSQAYLTKWLRYVSQPMTRFRDICDIKEATGRGKGDTFNWDIIANIDTAGAALTETSTIPDNSFTVTKGTATLTEYGNSITFTRKLKELSQHDVMDIVRKTLANDMTKVIDKAVFTAAQGSPLVFQASGGTSTSAVVLYTNGTGTQTNAGTAPLSYQHVINIVDTLKERNVPAFDAEGNYLCIAHPSTLTALRTALVSVNQYTESGYKKILNGEIGKFGGVRFIEQTNVSALSPTNAGAGGWAMFVGGEAIIEALAVPEEVLYQDNVGTDYNRKNGLAWYMIAGWKAAWTTAANARIAFWWPNASAVTSLTA